MRRSRFVQSVLGLAAAPLAGCYAKLTEPEEEDWREGLPGYRPLPEWRTMLLPEEFYILFEEGTEPPGSSNLNGEYRAGTFICAACFTPLFPSATKYETYTGWPSFWQPVEGRLGFKADNRLVEPRTAYHCRHCGGHQGHVFDDGPPPTFKRYCNNGLALRFILEGEPLPALRS